MNKKGKKQDIEYNTLCKRCEKTCKQTAAWTLVTCPHFCQKPEQLEIKFNFPKK